MFFKIYSWVNLLNSLSMATLSCMVSRLTIGKVVTLLFNSRILELFDMLGLALRFYLLGLGISSTKLSLEDSFSTLSTLS